MERSVFTARARRGLHGMTVLALVGLFTLLLSPIVARADNLVNSVANDINSVTITEDGSVVVNYWIEAANGTPSDPDASGCNATGANPATVQIGALPIGVTANPATFTISGCGSTVPVTFSASAPGTFAIPDATASGGKSGSNYDESTTDFKLVVVPADSTPPVITPSVSGTQGSNGWYVTNVTVSWSVVDNESSVTKTGCTTVNITADQGSTDYSCSASSAGGSAGPVTVSVKRDTTAPGISVTSIKKHNGSDYTPGTWTKTSEVTVTFACTDGLSGPANATVSQSVTTEGANQQVTGTCTDNAGNTNSQNVGDIDIDQTPPVITFVERTTPNGNGWNNTDVSVTWSCSDALSGAESDSVVVTVTTEGENQSAEGTCQDNAHNSASDTQTGINIDKSAPTDITFDGDIADEDVFEYDGVPSAPTCTANGAISGLDDCQVAGYGTGLGEHTLIATAIDNAGNQATAQISYTVADSTPPDIDCGSADGLWHAEDVTIDCTAADPGSGLADVGDAEFELTTDVDDGTETDNASTGTHDVSDNAGNTVKAGPISGNMVDKKPPVVSCDSPDTEWHGENVEIQCTATDGGSGPDSQNVTLSTNVAPGNETNNATTDSQTVADAVGNEATAGPVDGIKVDLKDPTITLDSRTPATADGWNNTDVTVTWNCADGGSGVVSPSDSKTVDTEGAGQSATGSCEDNVGHTAEATETDINIDKTVPTIAGSRTPDANGNGWNNESVKVSFVCDDALSGLKSTGGCTDPVTLSTEGENQSVEGQATDKAGNTNTDTVSGINIDLTDPTASATANPAPNANGWNKTDVTVSFTGNDSLSGIDVCDAPVVLSSEGDNLSASGSCTDEAGNSDTATASGIKIDKTAPTISGSRTPAANGVGWNNTNVTVTFTCGDTGPVQSGIGVNTVAGATLSADGAGQTVSSTGDCVDKAGNAATAASVIGIHIDKTDPSVSLVGGPANGVTYYVGYNVPAAPTCNASDALSGLNDPCSVSGYSTGVGTHTVTASATDNAGNTRSVSVTYTVGLLTLKGFTQPVDMNGVYNLVKGGSTVPLKFEVFAGSTELTNTNVVKSFTQAQITCSGTALTDEVETTTTGGTSLRYDTTGGQFIQNWQTPKTAGACYRVTMTTQDGSTLIAFFKLK